MNELKLEQVTKQFGTKTILDQISLSLEPQRIYGLLGRNGVGKTTLLSILCGGQFPTSGTVTLDGEPIYEKDTLLSKVFMAGEAIRYPFYLKVSEAFTLANRLRKDFHEEMAFALAGQFQLDCTKRIRELSTGYRTIFNLVLALSTDAPILLLDEPVSGLDASHRDLFYRILLANYAENPRTIVLSTHLIDEISPLVEEIILLKQGHVAWQESLESLLRKGYCISGTAALVEAYCKDKKVIGMDVLGGLRTAYLIGTPDNVLPAGLERSSLDLQKLFILLTNE